MEAKGCAASATVGRAGGAAERADAAPHGGRGFARAFGRAVRAEFLKARRTSVLKLALLLPLASALFAGAMTFMTAGCAESVWNWWYSLVMPGFIVLASMSEARIDGRQKLRTVLGVAAPPACTWLAKIVLCLVLLLAANFVTCLLACFFGSLVASGMPGVPQQLAAVALLTLTSAWLVPLALLLSTRFGLLASLLVTFVGTVGAALFAAAEPFWWAVPPAVPLRLMAPLLGVMPNGLLVEPGTVFASWDLAGAGIALTTALFCVLAWATAQWFERQEAR